MAFVRSRTARWLCCSALWCAMVGGISSGTVLAQPAVNTGKVSFRTGADFSHAFFFRGILQEKEGLIVQPYAEATFDLYEGTEGLSSATLTVGQWNSLHSGPTGADGPARFFDENGNAAENVKMWYRSDFYADLSLGLGNGWEGGFTYTSYLSPNDSFETVKEIALSLSYDDSETPIGGIALSPYAVLAIELDGEACCVPADPTVPTGEGVYVEFGIDPGLSIRDTPVSLSFPVRLAFSLSDYYEDPEGNNNAFGYFDLGAVASMPFGIPDSFGSWEVRVGGHLLFLGDSLEQFNGGDQFEAIGMVGLSIGY